MATRSKSKKASSRSSRNGVSQCALILATLLAFLLAASVGVLIWKMFDLESQFKGMSEGCPDLDIWEVYPGFFRNEQIQGTIIRLRQQNLNITRSKLPTLGCGFECRSGSAAPTESPTTPLAPANVFQPIPGRARVTQDPAQDRNLPGRFQPQSFKHIWPQQSRTPLFTDYVYHSCCISGTRYIAPDKALNLNNVEVKLAQFAEHKQYFLEESCDQHPTCRGCHCTQPEPFIYQAIIHAGTPDKYKVDSIILPGSCKCVLP